MRDVTRITGALRLGPAAALRLAAWKAYQFAVAQGESRTGHARYEAASTAFTDKWLKHWSEAGLSGWMKRPGAGRLPIEPAAAAEWCRTTCTPHDLALAEATARGTFDLLASGCRHLGNPPRWRTDLYSAIEWPLDEAHQVRIVRGDGSDIRTVWELSRSYHVVALARAYWSSGDAYYLRAFASHVDSWIEQNPFGRGPHWISPMDAAIRGANWALALVLLAEAPEIDPSFVARSLSNLYATALHVERHREWHPVYRGNHYVANGVGLAYLGALFRGDARGERWLRRGTRIIADELLRQVHPDGVSFEASIGYHRLATQLFGWGAEIVRLNAPDRWTQAHDERLAAMFEFIDAYTPVSGLAPMIGDNDDGHLHVMDARMLEEPRRHHLGLPPRPGVARPEARPASRLYRDGGFAVLRHGQDHCIVRCGPVGLLGAGSHDHNDQLSFELVIGGQRVVRDSGTFCYTRDLEQRFAFRATAAHNAVQLEGEEQNPIRLDLPWRVLEDRTRGRVREWSADAVEIRASGEHLGFAHLPGQPRIRREFRYLPLQNAWTVHDSVEHTGPSLQPHRIDWHLHFDDTIAVLAESPGAAVLRVRNVTVMVSFPATLQPALESHPHSNRYGETHPGSVFRLAGQTMLPVRITAEFR